MLNVHSTIGLFTLLSLVACADLAQEGDEVTADELRSAKVLRIDTSTCPDYYDEGGVQPLTPGSRLVLTAPADHVVEEMFGFEPDFVPGWSATQREDALQVNVNVRTKPVEFFSGVSRIMTTGPTGSHICYFDIQAKNVVKQSAFSWVGDGEFDRDLGSIPRGGALVIEGEPFGTPEHFTKVLDRDGTTPPTRVTKTSSDFGNGSYVWEGQEPGDYSVDLRVVFAGYADQTSHVRWRVER